MAKQNLTGRAASQARRLAQVNGKAHLQASGGASRTRAAATAAAPTVKSAAPATVTSTPKSTRAVRRSVSSSSSGRDASRARRLAMSSRGKAGVSSTDRQRTVDNLRANNVVEKKEDCGCGCNGRGDCKDGAAATTAPAMNLSSGVPKSSGKRHEPKLVTPSNAGRINSRMRRQALAKHGKTGADVFRKGLSSAQLVKQHNPNISGRDLAKSVRALRSTNGATGPKASSKPVGRRRPKKPSDETTGTKVAHSTKTTGDEVGLCRSVTGTDYLSSEVFAEFCREAEPVVPKKVETTDTLRGTEVTSGGKVGRSEKVTGDERGSCHTVTGIEYVGREHFDDFCKSKPEPGSAKVSFSQTSRGQIVSGSKPARSEKVTGDESGTCKAVTGTPYAGMEQFAKYCDPQDSKQARERTVRRSGNAGRDITGLQPGLEGLTGAEKGACRTVSGTSYLGAEQLQEVCGVMPAQVGESDFPQPIEGAPWSGFSVESPSHASQSPAVDSSVTGTSYEQGRISGTFSLGEGKITGTEQFRFGSGKSAPVRTAAKSAPTEEKVNRVTGEGVNVGMKITGDDWDRGDRVTGTEGTSAVRRNPTRGGPISAMPVHAPKRNEEVAQSDIVVTGGSGSTDKGALITVSGGARG